MTQLQHISANHLSFECKSCGHAPLVPVTAMIERYDGETKVDHVRAKARCSSCGQKTFQFRIVYRGGSYDALMGYCSINDEDYGSIMMQNTSCKLWAKFDVYNRYREQ